MKVKKLFKIVLIAGVILILGKSYSLATVQMESKSGTTAWIGITTTNAFTECLKLNSENSTLGTTNLRAHLSTDADWSAMAIFSASQFGGATINKPDKSNGNVTGIYGLDKIEFYQSTGIYEGTTSLNFTALLDPANSQYVKKYKIERTDNPEVWLKSTSEGGTFGWSSTYGVWLGDKRYPGQLKSGLFGVAMGRVWYLRKY